MDFRFPKTERLCHKHLFDTLFKTGQSFSIFPLKVVWQFHAIDEPVPAQTAFSVPKRISKLSVRRNRIKRLLRESFRKNKHPLYQSLTQVNKQAIVLFVYLGKVSVEYPALESTLIQCLDRLNKELKKDHAK